MNAPVSRRLVLVTLIGTSLLVCEATAQSPDSARAFLRELYAQYAPGQREPAFLAEEAPNYFTPPLLQLIRYDQKYANGEVGILDHDPICACQDYSDLQIVGPIDIRLDPGSKHASAEVTIVNLGRRTTISYRLAFDGRRWLIDDIAEGGIPSLQVFLKQGLEKYDKTKFGSL